jgi:hypothetical protein
MNRQPIVSWPGRCGLRVQPHVQPRVQPHVQPHVQLRAYLRVLLLVLLLGLALPLTAACAKQSVIGPEDDQAPIALMNFEDVGDGMSGVVYRRINDFDAFIAQVKTPVLVAFYHPLAEVNRLVIPRLEQMADDYQGQLAIVWIDGSSETALANNFNVNVLPQFTIVDEASIKRSLIGYDDQGAAKLKSLIAPYVSLVN